MMKSGEKWWVRISKRYLLSRNAFYFPAAWRPVFIKVNKWSLSDFDIQRTWMAFVKESKEYVQRGGVPPVTG